MAEPLQTLLRLRRLTVDQCRRALAECLRTEGAAAAAVREIEASIDRETDAACRQPGDDRMVEDFAVWLRSAKRELDLAKSDLLAAETRTQEARAALTAGRTGVETVQTLIAERAAERALDDRRREQLALDEAARGRRNGAAG